MDGRTDVYSLGVLLFWSLTRQHPYSGNTIAEVFAAQMTNRIRRLENHRGVDPRLAAIIERAICLDPRDRHASAAEMADELAHYCWERSRPTRIPVRREMRDQLLMTG